MECKNFPFIIVKRKLSLESLVLYIFFRRRDDELLKKEQTDRRPQVLSRGIGNLQAIIIKMGHIVVVDYFGGLH